MHDPHHSFAGDELFLRVIETEVDALDGSLSSQERHRCIQIVSERMQAEIEESVLTGSLEPAVITARIREEAARAIDGGASAA